MEEIWYFICTAVDILFEVDETIEVACWNMEYWNRFCPAILLYAMNEISFFIIVSIIGSMNIRHVMEHLIWKNWNT